MTRGEDHQLDLSGSDEEFGLNPEEVESLGDETSLGSESSEDECLVEKQLRLNALKKQARKERLATIARSTIAPETKESAERRSATYQIMKNKGLTRIRKKEVRNARVKYRNKFEKAVMRRKGQVRDAVKEAPTDYAGEESGLRTHVKKSIKLT
jgi:U3 small nucleolar RNA-associated protein 3